ncbi:MAG TPA: hypothetical protein VFB12_28190, partial [Ktedonobacteraceae bacterium]|nr:hypothetical protein [Ktedonobacteraceae bacterium]
MEQYYGMKLGELRRLDFSEVAQEIEDLLYGQPFHVPAQFAFTGRAVSTLVGVSTGLAPDFNFIDVATPYARKFLGLGIEDAGETAQEILRKLLDTGRVLLTLPSSVERLVTRIETGQIEVRVANGPGSKRSRGRRTTPAENSGNGGGSASLVFAFVASLGGGIYLTSVHLGTPGWFCLGLAGVTALGLLLKK